MAASTASALVIPDSLLAKEATEILREYSTDLLFNHSVRVYLFAAEQGRQQELRFDEELLYVAAAFHDLGLIKKFSSQNERLPARVTSVLALGWWRLGRLDDVGRGGLGRGRGVLACRGELLAESGDDLLEGGEFRFHGIDSRL